MKEEALELRDSTQKTLVKEEIEETNSSKKRDSVIKEYRYAVEAELGISQCISFDVRLRSTQSRVSS